MFRRCTLLRKAFAGYETFFIAFLVPHLSHVISIDVISYKNKFDHHYIILLKKG